MVADKSFDVAEGIRCLEAIDLFSAFPKEDIEGLAKSLTKVEFPAGATLCQEGELGTDMYILLSGSLKIFKGKRTIAVISPIDYVGEMSILETKPRSASVQIVEPSILLKITSEQFQSYFAKQPNSLVSMMKSLSRRIRRDTETLAEEFEKANILIHDMRNVLSVFAFLGSLSKEVQSKQGETQIQFMQKANKNLRSMMEEALANAKRLHYNPLVEKGSLVTLVEELIESEIKAHADLTNKEVKLKIIKSPPEFRFNQLEIRRVLLNLIINAGQASQPNDSIEVSINDSGEHVEISIKDNGSGIPAELQAKIFQPHFTTKPNGNGLGLPSCKRIIEKNNGGKISFQSRPDKGTIFIVILPY